MMRKGFPALSFAIRSVRYYKSMFAGAFLTLLLGVALIGVAAETLASALGVSPTTAGPSVTLTGISGGTKTYFLDAPDMQGIRTILGMSAVVSGFMTVVVVAGAFAFSIALRRRDIGLLRLVGTSAGEIRMLVLGEALIVAVPGAAVGCLIAWAVTPSVVRALNHTDLTPVRLPEAAGVGPLIGAYGVGLFLATVAAVAASQRAARVLPIEALRDAALDAHVMTRGRALAGVLALSVGLAMVGLAPTTNVANSTALAIFGTFALTIAAIALGPLYLPVLARLCGVFARWPAWLSARLAVAGVVVSRRRTSSLAAPVMSITAVVGIMLGVMGTTNATDAADQAARIRGQLVVQPVGQRGLGADTLRRVARAPRVRAVSAVAPIKVAFGVEGGGAAAQVRSGGVVSGGAVDLRALAATERVRTVEGRIRPLKAHQIAIRQEFSGWYGAHVGSRLRLGFSDGRVVDATVAAVLHSGSNLPQVLLSPAVPGGRAGPAPYAIVRLRRTPTDAAVAAAHLARALGTRNVRVIPTAQWHRHKVSGQTRLQGVAMLILAVPASVFALIALANIIVMSFGRRGPEIAGLTLLGARPGMVRRMVVLEALLVALLGLGLGGLLVASGLSGYHGALTGRFLATAIRVPWRLLGGLAIASLVVSTATSLVVVTRVLRRPAMAMVTLRE